MASPPHRLRAGDSNSAAPSCSPRSSESSPARTSRKAQKSQAPLPDDPEKLPGGRGRSGGHAGAGELHLSSFSSQLPLPLSLFSTETAPPKPLPFTPAPANNQLRGHKAATTPPPFLPLPFVCFAELSRDLTIKKNRIHGRLGRTARPSSRTLSCGNLQGPGRGGGVIVVKQWGQEIVLLLIRLVQSSNNKWLHLTKAISSWRNFMTEKR